MDLLSSACRCLIFCRFWFYLATKDKLKLEFLITARFSSHLVPSHKVEPIDISITSKKQASKKFTPILCRLSEERFKKNRMVITSLWLGSNYDKATVCNGDSAERPSIFDIRERH